ncbi:MAG: enoyl-CoA hydratase-related protein [Sneathiella sp.]
MSARETSELISQSLDRGVLLLTLQGTSSAHALSEGMIHALQMALNDAAKNEEVRVIVLHGPGKIFCAGHDLKEIARHRADEDAGKAYLTSLLNSCGNMMQTVTMSPKPTIALVEGIATAGGLQLVAACDLAFASKNATFCLPGVNQGGFCTTPAVAVARNLSRKVVMELALTGDVYDADWAREAGLLNRVLPAEDVIDFTMAFALKLATRNPKATADGKQTLYRQMELPLEQAYAHATDVMIGHFMDPVQIEDEQANWG